MLTTGSQGNVRVIEKVVTLFLQPNLLYRGTRFANFEKIWDFSVPSIILAGLLRNTCLLEFSAFRSTLFISVF